MSILEKQDVSVKSIHLFMAARQSGIALPKKIFGRE
jgi:hypothetical protein